LEFKLNLKRKSCSDTDMLIRTQVFDRGKLFVDNRKPVDRDGLLSKDCNVLNSRE